MCPQNPRRQAEDRDNAYSDDGIVDSLRGHRVRCWQAEDNRNESNPAHSDQGYDSAHETQVERPFLECFGVNESKEDRDAVGYVKSYRSDGGSCCESDARTERGQRETEGEEGCEPDSANGGAEAIVDFVEEVWL